MKKKLLMLGCVLAAATLGVACNEAPHEHSFADAWTSDATNHWHVATCEHTTETSGKAAHADADKDGDCDVCGYEIGTKAYVKAAVDLAISKANTINAGKVVMDSDADHDTADYLEFELGQDGMKLTSVYTRFDNDRSSETEEDVMYYSDFEGTTFGAYEEVDTSGSEPVTVYSRIPNDDVSNGMDTAHVLPASDLYLPEGELAGAEAVLSALWTIADANAFGTSVYNVNGNVYSFTADYLDEDEAWYLVANVEFKLGAEGHLAWAKVEINNYTVEGDTLAREQATDPIVLSPYAVPGSNKYFVVEQTAGAKTADVVPAAASAEGMLVSDFTIFQNVDNTPVEVTDAPIAVEVAESVMFALGQIVDDEPQGINAMNEVITVSTEADITIDEDMLAYGGIFNVVVNEPTAAGETFAVTVSTEKVSKTIYFTATRPAITSLSVKDDKDRLVSSVNGFEGIEYTFKAVATPNGAEPAYTVVCDVTDGVTLTDNQDGTWTFKATAVGNYELTFTSAAKNASDEDVVATVALTIAELPEVQTLFDKTKGYTDGMSVSMSIDWTDDWKSGKFMISDTYNFSGVLVLDYTYDPTTLELTTSVNMTATESTVLESLVQDWSAWGGPIATTSYAVALSSDMLSFSLVKTVSEDYGYGPSEYSNESTLNQMTIYDSIAAAWANSCVYDNNDISRDGYILMVSDAYKANVMLQADQTGRLFVEQDGSVIRYDFNYTVTENDGAYVVTITDLAHNDVGGYGAAHADNMFVTLDGTTYTLSGAVSLAGDFTSLTIGSTTFELYQNG